MGALFFSDAVRLPPGPVPTPAPCAPSPHLLPHHPPPCAGSPLAAVVHSRRNRAHVPHVADRPSPLAAVRPSPGGPPTDPAFAKLGEAAAPSRPPKTPRIRAAPHPLRWFTVLATGSGLPRFVSSLFYPTYCSLDAKVPRITGTTSRKACICLACSCSTTILGITRARRCN